jgi:hypothetical protein
VGTGALASELGFSSSLLLGRKVEEVGRAGLYDDFVRDGIHPSGNCGGTNQDVKNLPLSLTNMDSKPKPTPAGVDMGDLVTRLLKYVLEGLAVAVAAYVIPGKTMRWGEVAMIALTATATFAILDIYAPSVGSSARTGAGFGIGAGLVGFPA